MWFNLEYLKASEDVITVAVPSSFYRDQVKQRYQNYIETRLRNLIGKDVSIFLEVKPRTEQPAAVKPQGQPAVNPSPPGTLKSPGKKAFHSQLRNDYTFDRYVIGDNNLFAANAAMAIGRNPGTTSYNPFLLYGGVGLGKTHLMQAIGNYIYENSESKIIYITAENFTNEFIQALREDKMPAFKNRYRYVDVLLIDDIHFLEKKDGTQEELFYTFDALYHAKKQIVFTCDRPIAELKNLTERLKSRFEWGLKVDLQPPNYETRYAILKKKSEDKKVIIPDEVIALISNKVSTNVRDLEGAFNTLTAYAELVGKPITLEIARQQLKDVFASPKQANMSIDIIIRVVAEHFALSPNDLKGPKRTQNIVFPRQLAMYITGKITTYSTTEIGQYFGDRDHTTVMHSCQKIENQLLSDPTMYTTIENLKRKIKEYSAKS
jgi:chromosomal replication initiator protein